MATVVETRRAKPDAAVEREITRAGDRIRVNDALTGAVALLVLVLGYAVGMTLLDRWLDLPREVRQLGFGAFVLTAAGVGYWLVVRPLRRAVNPRFVARQIEATAPGVKNAVINYVDLKDRDLPETVRAAVGTRAAEGLHGADVNRATESRRLLALGVTAALLVATLAGLFVLCKPAQFLSLLGRSFNPFSSASIASRTQITLIEPAGGDLAVTAGDPVRVAVTLGGSVPDPDGPARVRLLFKHNPVAAEYDELPLDRGATDRDWSLRLPDYVVQNGFWFKVAAGDAATPEYRVTVRPRPLFKAFEAKYEYPAYLRLPPETSREPALEAYRGTTVILTARTNRPDLRGGRMLVEGQRDPLVGDVVGDTRDALRFKLTLTETTTYRLAFVTAAGEQGDPTPPYPIKVIPDRPPTVQIAAPADEEITLPANGLLPVDGTAGDDFGVASVTLRLRAAGKEPVALAPKKYRDGKPLRREADGSYPTLVEYKDSVSLADLKTDAGAPAGLKPGMVVEYWLEAADNCTVPRANVGKSRVQRVRLDAPVTEPEKKDQQAKDVGKRQAQEKQHQAAQDKQFQNEKRDNKPPHQGEDGQQPPDQAADPMKGDEPKKNDPGQPGDGGQKPDAGQPKGGDKTQPNGGENAQPQPGGGEQNPMPAQPAKNPNDPATKPDAAPQDPAGKQGNDTKPEKGGDPNGGGNPGQGNDPARDQDVQKKAEAARRELERQQKEDAAAGAAKPNPDAAPKGNEPKPAESKKGDGEQSGGETKPEPKSGDQGTGGQQRGSKDGAAGESKGGGTAPKPDAPAAPKEEPKPSGDGATPDAGKPGEEKSAPPQGGTGGEPKPGQDPKGGGNPDKTQPDAGPKPEPGADGQAGANKGAGPDDKSGKPGGEQRPDPKKAETKPMGGDGPGQEKAPPPKGEGADAEPGHDKGGEAKAEKPNGGGAGKPGPSGDKPGQPAGGDTPQGATEKPTPGGDPSKPSSPDNAPGADKPDGRKPAEPGGNGTGEGTKTDDPGTEKPAPQPGQEVERNDQNTSKNGRPPQGELSRETAGSKDPDAQPAGPQDEGIERLGRQREQAQNLNSKDGAKKKKAEDHFDNNLGKKDRERLQQDQRDAQAGDPGKADATKKDADELTKKAARNERRAEKDAAELTKKARDLASDDKGKREKAENDLDQQVGKDRREEMQKAAKDAASGDPKRQKAGGQKLDDLAKDAAQEKADRRNNREPTKEEVEKMVQQAKDLASDDKAKREAAEKAFDQRMGKENREKLQDAMKAQESGDPKRAEEGRKKLEQMAKDAQDAAGDRADGQGPPNPADGTADRPRDRWQPGGGGGVGNKGTPLDADPKNAKKSADLQLQQFEKNRFNKELQDKLGMTQAEFDRFLAGYRDVVNRMPAADAKPPAAGKEPDKGTGPAAIRVGEGSGGAKVEHHPDGVAGTVGSAGPSAAPPGFTDAQRRFAEEAAKLRQRK